MSDRIIDWFLVILATVTGLIIGLGFTIVGVQAYVSWIVGSAV